MSGISARLLFLSLGQRENWLPTLAKQTTLTGKELKAEGK
jgi:hypothetical protein